MRSSEICAACGKAAHRIRRFDGVAYCADTCAAPLRYARRKAGLEPAHRPKSYGPPAWKVTDFLCSHTALSDGSIEAYRSAVAGFAEWADADGIAGPVDVDPKVCRRYLQELRVVRGLSDAYLARNCSALRRYFRWTARRLGGPALDPLRRICSRRAGCSSFANSPRSSPRPPSTTCSSRRPPKPTSRRSPSCAT